MGNSRKRHNAVMAKSLYCIYCGGQNLATTVDHMPPIIMFDGRDRPRGFEFPACKICNNDTHHVDLVSAWFSRFYPDPTTERQRNDIEKLLISLHNNKPELLEEMKMSRAAEEDAMRKMPIALQSGGLLAVGPRTQQHLDLFALKMGLALHFETTSVALKSEGRIIAKTISNYQLFEGSFPLKLEEILGPDRTLSAGKKEVSNQFKYAWRHTDEKDVAVYFASFRLSFAVVCFVSTKPDVFKLPNSVSDSRQYSPVDIPELIRKL